MFSQLNAFIRLSRPHFLLSGLALFGLGAIIARYEGFAIDVRQYLLGQLFVTSLQLMLHYLNDHYDVENDGRNTARTWFSGGSGVLNEGRLSAETAFTLGLAALAVATAAAVTLVAQHGLTPATWVVMGLIFLGLFFHSAPPIRLGGSGYGELTVSITFAGLVPAFAHLLFTGRASPLVLLATAPLVALHLAMMLAFSLPDFLSDEAAGKQTLVVRLGRRSGISVHNALIAVALGLAAINSFIGLPPRVALAALFTAPLAVWQIAAMRRVRQGEPVSFNRLLLGEALLFALTTYFTAFNFWVLIL